MDLIFIKSLRPLYCDYISRILCVRRAQQRRPPRPPFMYFYSRPYARGDASSSALDFGAGLFLLTPLREGRPCTTAALASRGMVFLLTPLREGRPFLLCLRPVPWPFLLAPLREGRPNLAMALACRDYLFLLTPLREGRPISCVYPDRVRIYFYSRPYARGNSVPIGGTCAIALISTHAPTRGATAIFHKTTS